MLESCPEFEAQADLSDLATLELMAVARKRLEVIYAIMGGQGSVRSLTAGGDRRPSRACVSIAENAHRKGESLLAEL